MSHQAVVTKAFKNPDSLMKSKVHIRLFQQRIYFTWNCKRRQGFNILSTRETIFHRQILKLNFLNSLIIHKLRTQLGCINMVRCMYVDTKWTYPIKTHSLSSKIDQESWMLNTASSPLDSLLTTTISKIPFLLWHQAV